MVGAVTHQTSGYCQYSCSRSSWRDCCQRVASCEASTAVPCAKNCICSVGKITGNSCYIEVMITNLFSASWWYFPRSRSACVRVDLWQWTGRQSSFNEYWLPGNREITRTTILQYPGLSRRQPTQRFPFCIWAVESMRVMLVLFTYAPGSSSAAMDLPGYRCPEYFTSVSTL